MGFPRLHCRGLIEADLDANLVSDYCDFRGFIAAASLKRVDGDRHQYRLSDFRGFIAAASLKRRLHEWANHGDRRISAASLPRPH